MILFCWMFIQINAFSFNTISKMFLFRIRFVFFYFRLKMKWNEMFSYLKAVNEDWKWFQLHKHKQKLATLCSFFFLFLKRFSFSYFRPDFSNFECLNATVDGSSGIKCHLVRNLYFFCCCCCWYKKRYLAARLY